jgi:C4-dicarboxylate-specific signal transduction histidine kinase
LLDDVLDLLAKKQYDDDVRVIGNDGELRQVLVNLIAYVIDALARGGTSRSVPQEQRVPWGTPDRE